MTGIASEIQNTGPGLRKCRGEKQRGGGGDRKGGVEGEGRAEAMERWWGLVRVFSEGVVWVDEVVGFHLRTGVAAILAPLRNAPLV